MKRKQNQEYSEFAYAQKKLKLIFKIFVEYIKDQKKKG